MPPIVGVAQTPSYVPVQYSAAPAPLSQSMSPSMVSVSYAQPSESLADFLVLRAVVGVLEHF